MQEILDIVILAAVKTANQASGNDKTDWICFAEALQALKEHLPHPEPRPD